MVRLPPFVQSTFALSNCGCNWNALTQQSFAFDLACGFSLISLTTSLPGLQEFRIGKQSIRHVAIMLGLSLEHNTCTNCMKFLLWAGKHKGLRDKLNTMSLHSETSPSSNVTALLAELFQGKPVGWNGLA